MGRVWITVSLTTFSRWLKGTGRYPTPLGTGEIQTQTRQTYRFIRPTQESADKNAEQLEPSNTIVGAENTAGGLENSLPGPNKAHQKGSLQHSTFRLWLHCLHALTECQPNPKPLGFWYDVLVVHPRKQGTPPTHMARPRLGSRLLSLALLIPGSGEHLSSVMNQHMDALFAHCFLLQS